MEKSGTKTGRLSGTGKPIYKKKTNAEMVLEFHQTYKLPIGTTPHVPEDEEVIILCVDLIQEEFDELKLALIEFASDRAAYLDGASMSIITTQAEGLTNIADALGDLIYVVYGMALTFGIPLDECIKEIHRSSMTKLGANGRPIIREDGKILKGPNYKKPNLRLIIDNAMK